MITQSINQPSIIVPHKPAHKKHYLTNNLKFHLIAIASIIFFLATVITSLYCIAALNIYINPILIIICYFLPLAIYAVAYIKYKAIPKLFPEYRK